MSMKKAQENSGNPKFASTDRLLMVIVGLLVRQEQEVMISLRRQVEILNNLGMRPVEIAGALGKSSTYVNKELSGLRKSAKREE
jgi:hypothetical protein